MRRRRWLFVGVSLLALIGCLLVFVFVVYGAVGEWMVRSKVVPKLEKRLGRQVTIGDVQVKRGHAVLKDVVVKGPDSRDAGEAPLVRIARIDVDFAFWPSLFGGVEVSDVRLDGVRAIVHRDFDGDNYSDLVSRLRGRDDPAGAGSGSSGLGSMKPKQVKLTGGRFEINDRRAGVTMIGTGMTGSIDYRGNFVGGLGDLALLTDVGPHASVENLSVKADAGNIRESAVVEVAGGEVFLWNGMTLTGVTGNLSQGLEAGEFAIDFAGGYGGAEGTLWSAKGTVAPEQARGNLRISAERFTLNRIASVLEDSMVRDFRDTAIGASLSLDLRDGRLTYSGDIDVQGLNVFHRMLAPETVRDVSLTGAIEGSYDQKSKVLHLTKAAMNSRGIDYGITATVALPLGLEEDGSIRTHKRGELRLVVPPVGCQKMLDSIPPQLVHELIGFQLKGTFATDVRVAVDMADLEATVLDGSVGIRGCKVVSAPETMDARRFAKSFDHEVEVAPEVFETISISPENLSFTPISSVSVHLLNSFMTTEDSAFFRHRGFITREFRTALIKNLEAGYFKYGASSITMQLVKNVFLHREKTLARKLQELFLTWYIETKLDKDRLFEIYVNAIEYGPGLYGIKPATYQYFGKHPADINPVEAAFFSTLLPSPRRRYKQFCKGKLSRWTEKKIQRILGTMHQRDRLTDEELAEAQTTELVFQPDKSGFCDRKYPGWGIR